MKKLIFAVAAISASLSASAQVDNTQRTSREVTTSAIDQEKVQIKIEDLPAAVQTALKSEKFQGWNPKTAYVVKSENPYYEVELANEKAEKTVVKFKEDGTILD